VLANIDRSMSFHCCPKESNLWTAVGRHPNRGRLFDPRAARRNLLTGHAVSGVRVGSPQCVGQIVRRYVLGPCDGAGPSGRVPTDPATLHRHSYSLTLDSQSGENANESAARIRLTQYGDFIKNLLSIYTIRDALGNYSLGVSRPPNHD
jgi:hypothetical protein